MHVTFLFIFVHMSNCMLGGIVGDLLMLIGMCSVFIGSIGALYQVKIKRMLAFSGVAI